MTVFILALLALLTWLYLIFARGGYWLGTERDTDAPAPPPGEWPSVTAVVPARNEGDVIGRTVGSLLAQSYPGEFHIVLVDDQSTDGTAEEARAQDRSGRLTVIEGTTLPEGWTGKLWALDQGIARATERYKPDYLLLTDADIAHDADNLQRLVARAEAGKYALVTLMAKLTCQTFAEKLLIPAFIYFFQMLYPFSWVNRPSARMAAGAGGCMLVRATALEAAGGVASVRKEIIDDCALGKRLKMQGPIWLGLTERARSVRPYADIAEIGRMVSRTAFTQLRYSWVLLSGVVLAMLFVFVLPPVLAFFSTGTAFLFGAATWALMTISFLPILRFYRQSPLWGLALPLIACFYLAFTIKSAMDHRRGRGGLWKGRAQAMQ